VSGFSTQEYLIFYYFVNENLNCFFPNQYATHNAHFLRIMASGLGSAVALLLESGEVV
jgi:hypothetical protein